MSDDKPAVDVINPDEWFSQSPPPDQRPFVLPSDVHIEILESGVDLAQGSDQQPFAAIESTFYDPSAWSEAKPMTLADLNAAYDKLRDASPPAWKEPRTILVSPQEAAALAQWRAINEQATARDYQNDPSEIAEIDTGVVYEPQQYPSVVGRWTVTREQATRYPLRATWHPDEGEQYAAGFWLPYCASAEDARQHIADFYYTRVEDTRGANGAQDMVRWRDPAHRAELTRRALEYAECAQTLVDR